MKLQVKTISQGDRKKPRSAPALREQRLYGSGNQLQNTDQWRLTTVRGIIVNAVTRSPNLTQFFLRPTLEVAPLLLGWRLMTSHNGHVTGGTIVEVEAYRQDDPASHSWRGISERTRPMFAAGGHAYVYLIYGIHHCVNVVTEEAGIGAALLIRALQPLAGLEIMCARRGTDLRHLLASGPGRLCQALAISRDLSGQHLLTSSTIWLERRQLPRSAQVATSRRIGITRAVSKQWRFYVKDSPWISTHRGT